MCIASFLQVAIKLSINKLTFDDGFDGFVDAIHKNEFALLEIEPEHIKETMNLPHIHRDPFDRMLIAQANLDDMATGCIFYLHPVLCTTSLPAVLKC